MTLTDRIPTSADPDSLFDTFTTWVGETGIDPYPAQLEALMELATGSNVILSTPTGTGKSLVATGAHFMAIATDRTTFYTAPIKALVSEKFFALIEVFGADNVGMMTGDSSVNADAPIICATAEIVANLALREGAEADIGLVVMDEFHFYSDPDRGWAWQVPLLELPHAQFLLMSATLGDVSFFERDLTGRTGRATSVVTSAQRPVPLFYRYVLTPMPETIDEIVETKQAPAYLVHFSQAAAITQASALTSVNVATRAERDQIIAELGGFRFSSGFGRTLSRMIRHGIGVHHAGMLPKYRRLVERLAQAGLLKIICGTDTLGVGINVPIRTVVFTAMSKYDGTRSRLLTAREFHQIAGRAGRAGYDDAGNVIAQAPEHVIENEKALAKAGDDPKKRRKVVKKKPPPGQIGWGEPTFTKLIEAEPEPLTSSFTVNHAMLLNVVARPGDAFAAMRKLLTDNHCDRATQRKLILRAISIYRSLLAAGIVERLDTPDEAGRTVRLTEDLQWDFTLNQPLAPFALAAIELLDDQAPGYALDVLSIVEATVEDPWPVLRAQTNKAKGEAVATMKAEGIEYTERMELLEDVNYPQPLTELLDPAFETYRRAHPWVADAALSPKSVVRDLHERAMNFVEYIGFYQLARSEGLVLRYLADVYAALRRTVPDRARTEELEDITVWLGELVRQVDGSLLEEWERLRDPEAPEQTVGPAPEPEAPPVTRNERAFRVLVRNQLFRLVECCARRDYETLAELTDLGAQDWAEAVEDYFAEHAELGTGPDARGPALLMITIESQRWLVRQIFDDPEGDHDWGILAEIDLAASDEAGVPVLRILEAGELT
ncbi:DEAD/DEAH box helicase [Sciscionella marina]|uniref:DEAD/DEAH box helicase n=1 Tax=Sciscionella marina TaxID=508770 RepID=UPI00035E78EC|nr:DEAD/DEAH box helicase [Sciscionella marina]